MAQIVGIVDGPPFDICTWSGSSSYLFRELQKRESLVTAYSASPNTFIKRVLQARVFAPNKAQWQVRHHLDPFLLYCMSKIGRRQLKGTKRHFDTVLQIGAWYNLTDNRYLNTSYHDGNLAMRIANPFGFPQISQKYIENALQFEKKLYQNMDIIFTMSRWLKQSFIDDFHVDPQKIHVVGAGINLPKILDSSERTHDKPVILMVAREFTRKGGEDVLQAFTKIQRRIPEVRLQIIGPTLKTLPPGVECLQYLSKNTPEDLEILLSAYLNASVFVMPSLYEPFGIPFLEAMAHRLPCVGTNICAMPEIIQDGTTGFLVPPNSPDLLAEKLLLLLQSPTLCRKFGDAGYSHYTKNFTWHIVAEKILAAINEALECRKER